MDGAASPAYCEVAQTSVPVVFDGKAQPLTTIIAYAVRSKTMTKCDTFALRYLLSDLL